MRLEFSIGIERSAADVFNLVSDLRNDIHWQKALIEVRKATPGPIGVGTRFQQHIRVMGNALPLEIEVRQFRRHCDYVLDVSWGDLVFTTTVGVQAIGRGSRLTVLAEGKFSGLAKLATVALSHHRSNQIKADLENLRLLMDAGTL